MFLTSPGPRRSHARAGKQNAAAHDGLGLVTGTGLTIAGTAWESEWKTCEILETRSKPLQGSDDLVHSEVCLSYFPCRQNGQVVSNAMFALRLSHISLCPLCLSGYCGGRDFLPPPDPLPLTKADWIGPSITEASSRRGQLCLVFHFGRCLLHESKH